MRATIFAAIGLTSCLGLAGCGDNAPPAHVQAVQSCNCEAPTPPLARLTPPRVSHRHARTASYRESHREYDESYSYRSQSRSSYQSDYGDRYSSRGNAEEAIWVDGYGRSHFVATASAAFDDRARLAPWHGYDEDYDDKDGR